MTRKSFLKTLAGFFASLCFWKNAAKPPTDEFKLDGLEHIMWAIDNEFGEAEGVDPWIAEKQNWPDLNQMRERNGANYLAHPMFQKYDEATGTYFIRWGDEGVTPEFQGESFHDALLKATTWASSRERTIVSGFNLLIQMPA